MQDDVQDPIAHCPIACDGVIPIVYPNQPITVPYSAIRGEMTLIQRAAIDEVESVKRTFTRPDTIPPMSIHSSASQAVKVLGLGHAGVAFYNGQTGEVAYYEYGRYGGDYGAVRTADMPRLTFDEKGNPEMSSFQELLKKLTTTNGGPYSYEAVFVKLPNGSFDVMKEFADQRQADAIARTAAAYDVKGNHCFTFALEVANSAGVNTNVSSAQILEMVLVSAIGTGISPPDGSDIELPSRQMRELQNRFRPLNVDQSGNVAGEFSFPAGPYSK